MFIFAVMSYFRPLAAALVYAISYGVQSVGLPRCTADPPEAKQLSRARLHTFGAPARQIILTLSEPQPVRSFSQVR